MDLKRYNSMDTQTFPYVTKKEEERDKRIIKRRKVEYRKREEEGNELLVNTFGCSIGISKQCVTVKKEGKLLAKKPAGTLSHIMISSKGVSLSSNLIGYCLENKISIDFFTFMGVHIGSILSDRYMEGRCLFFMRNLRRSYEPSLRRMRISWKCWWGRSRRGR